MVLGFIPIVLDDGQISIKILTEVSELSAAGAITIDALTIPALSTRRAETTVNLGSGQSFAIAGLLQNTTNNALDRFPGLGELPILGSLFAMEAHCRIVACHSTTSPDSRDYPLRIEKLPLALATNLSPAYSEASILATDRPLCTTALRQVIVPSLTDLK